jgi:hypothetical protein
MQVFWGGGGDDYDEAALLPSTAWSSPAALCLALQPLHQRPCTWCCIQGGAGGRGGGEAVGARALCMMEARPRCCSMGGSFSRTRDLTTGLKGLAPYRMEYRASSSSSVHRSRTWGGGAGRAAGLGRLGRPKRRPTCAAMRDFPHSHLPQLPVDVQFAQRLREHRHSIGSVADAACMPAPVRQGGDRDNLLVLGPRHQPGTLPDQTGGTAATNCS